MATIASLNVYLNAQTEGFSKGVESATRETVRFMMQLDQQARTLGMTADEAKLYNLEMRGVEKSLVGVARETLNTVNALKAQQSATAAAKALASELQLQAATFHMTADAAQIYRLEIQGADKAVIQAAKDHALFLQFLREEKRWLDEVTASATKNAAATAATGTAAASRAGGGDIGALGQAKGIGQLLKGGGVLIGVTLIADAVKKLGDGIADAVHGAGTFGERMDRLARSLPVLGKVYESFESIANSITGTKQMLELENERTKKLDSQIAKVNELRDARIKAEQEVARIANETIRQGQQMTAENDAARSKAVQREAQERQKFADAMEKSRRENQERQRRIEGYAIEAARKKEQERLKLQEDSLKKQLELSKAAESALPKEMRFASATLATASNMGIGEAFRNSMSIDFGNDRSKIIEKLNKEQLEIQRKIEENTRRQGALSNANFN